MPGRSLSLIDEVIAETRRRSSEEDVPRAPHEPAPSAVAEDPVAASWPSTLEQIGEATQDGVRELLLRASSDDIVCMVAEGSDGLRRCIEAQLDDASLAWLRQHLQVWTPTTRRYRDECEQRLLAISSELVTRGRFQRRVDEEVRSEVEDAELVEALGRMIAALRERDRSAARLLADEDCDPMLAHGLRLISTGMTGQEMHRALEAPAEALRAQYARRLMRIHTALCIAADGGSEADLRAALRAQGL